MCCIDFALSIKGAFVGNKNHGAMGEGCGRGWRIAEAEPQHTEKKMEKKMEKEMEKEIEKEKKMEGLSL